MKLAIIGSRNLTIDNLDDYIPWDVDEIITGGAKGIDACAMEYANVRGIKLTVLKPNYPKYKKGAPLMRNEEIINRCDCFIAFWDGSSKGTRHSLIYAWADKPNGVVYLFRDGRYRVCMDEKMWMEDKNGGAVELHDEYDRVLDEKINDLADFIWRRAVKRNVRKILDDTE